eukprot:SAG11_NODE_34376_length_272_cov_0.838150_1_plen_65_part_01
MIVDQDFKIYTPYADLVQKKLVLYTCPVAVVQVPVVTIPSMAVRRVYVQVMPLGQGPITWNGVWR